MSLEEKVSKLERALEEVLARLDKVEQKIGSATGKVAESLAAPIPAPTQKNPGVITSSVGSGIQPTIKKKQIIKQTLPRGGAVSQVKAKKGIYHCPQCDSDYYEELDDKSNPMYTMGPGMAIYKKKLRCWNCGHEWPKPT